MILLPRARPHRLGGAMRVGVRGMDLILSRSGRYIDALCLRKSIKEVDLRQVPPTPGILYLASAPTRIDYAYQTETLP